MHRPRTRTRSPAWMLACLTMPVALCLPDTAEAQVIDPDVGLWTIEAWDEPVDAGEDETRLMPEEWDEDTTGGGWAAEGWTIEAWTGDQPAEHAPAAEQWEPTDRADPQHAPSGSDLLWLIEEWFIEEPLGEEWTVEIWSTEPPPPEAWRMGSEGEPYLNDAVELDFGDEPAPYGRIESERFLLYDRPGGPEAPEHGPIHEYYTDDRFSDEAAIFNEWYDE